MCSLVNKGLDDLHLEGRVSAEQEGIVDVWHSWLPTTNAIVPPPASLKTEEHPYISKFPQDWYCHGRGLLGPPASNIRDETGGWPGGQEGT